MLAMGCGGSSSGDGASGSRPAQPEAAVADGSRCLPVVSVGCGCVYGCGPGAPDAGGRFIVEHDFWSSPLTARVQRWCVDGECTEAFAAELVCAGICTPRAADATCAFRRGRCVTGRQAAIVEAAYRVFVGDTQVGGLSLAADGTYAYSGSRDVGAERFHFMSLPHGRYTVDARVGELWPSEVPDGHVVAVVHFDPQDAGYAATDPSRSFEVRHDRGRGLFIFHGIVSELQTWRVEAERPADP